uniref:Uncharacterized protein n=1 Tax=Coturnix japonica TaxID=93934 RepID=A0A8C2Y8J7_COTJA
MLGSLKRGSLQLHFLQTLEHRTDVSVTSTSPRWGEAFALLLLPPLLIPWRPRSMQEVESDHRRIHLLCVLMGEHKWRPRQWGPSIRGASCGCACTGVGHEQV